MTDRELLKLAAKAIHFKWDDQAFDGTLITGKARWNPLTDDGDALRLAVKLNLSVDFFDDAITVEHTPDNAQCYEVIEPVGTDPYAATRRAIVRAAVEIGRTMP